MMTIDRGPDGAETISLRPTGWGRYIDVIFLAVWLTFWLFFEAAALAWFGAMLVGLAAGAFGIELSFASRMAPDGSAPFFILFMLVWLTIWTVGGIAAGTHFLRALAGRDVISVSPAGLQLEWRAGPFRKHRTIAHGDIRRLRLGLKEAPVVVDAASGTVEITTFGTKQDRDAALDWLRTRLVVPDEAQARRLDADTVPSDWEVEVEGMETRLATPKRRTRRIGGVVLWAVAAVVFTRFLPALHESPSFNTELIEAPVNSVTGVHLAALGLAMLIALWAAWMTWGRAEWIVESGRLTWRRSFASWRRERTFEHATLEVEHTFDSDGDNRYTLRVRGATTQRKISSALHDSAELVRLAEWLSARTRFPIDKPSA